MVGKLNVRLVYVFYANNGWFKSSFENLKEGQLFVMFESDGKKVFDSKGKDRWIAARQPYYDTTEGTHVVDVLPYIRLVTS